MVPEGVCGVVYRVLKGVFEVMFEFGMRRGFRTFLGWGIEG